jgi:phage terminase large subunit-like protein
LTENKEKNYVAIAKRYAEAVVSGKISACSWVRKACRRQLDDLKRAKVGAWRYRFDAKRAVRICQFVEGFHHIKGEWAKRNEQIVLQPWQIFIYTTIFGWVDRDSGLRRFRTVYIECPRKNSKSTMSAPVALYLMAADGEAGQEVYSAATTRDQAKIVWEAAKQMVDRDPGFRKTFGVDTSAHSIYQMASASKFIAISAEGNSLDGLNGSSIVDELHAHRTRKVYDVLETAKAARQQPLLWNITTAGSDRSGICYELRTYVTKILDAVAQDDSVFGIIYTTDEGDDWTDEATWKKANPNYGVSVDPEELRRLCLKAQKMPSAMNNFLTKHLSVWVNADVGLFDISKWQALGDPSLDPEQFKDKPCWLGLDLAPRHDFSSRIQLFEVEKEDGVHYYVFPRHFLSEGEIEASANSQYAGWAREGWITTNSGNSTSYDDIEEDLRGLNAQYQVREVAYDPATAKEIVDHMSAEGMLMVEMRPLVLNFSEPTKRLDALMADGRIHHNGDPVLTWMLSNVVGHYDRKDNVYPVKERRENAIDGVVALIMALGRALANAPKPEPQYQAFFVGGN